MDWGVLTLCVIHIRLFYFTNHFSAYTDQITISQVSHFAPRSSVTNQPALKFCASHILLVAPLTPLSIMVTMPTLPLAWSSDTWPLHFKVQWLPLHLSFIILKFKFPRWLTIWRKQSLLKLWETLGKGLEFNLLWNSAICRMKFGI